MIGFIQVSPEFALEPRLDLGVDIRIAPDRARERGCLAAPSFGSENARKGKLSRRGLGIGSTKEALNEHGVLAVTPKRLLAALLEPGEGGPDRMGLHEVLQTLEPCLARECAQRDPLKR